MLRHVDNQQSLWLACYVMPILKISFHLLEMEVKCFRIVKVDSTFLWVQLENRDDFEELLEDFTRRMTRPARLLRHRPDYVLPDELVAVREEKGWQRGIVTQGDLVTVALRDWGRAIQRPVYDIYILEDRFRELEWQTIPLRTRSYPAYRRKVKMVSKNQRTNKAAPGKTRRIDKDPRIHKRRSCYHRFRAY